MVTFAKIKSGLMMSMLCALLCSCASAPVMMQPTALFNDHLFAPPSMKIDAEQIFALSSEMKQYLKSEIAEQLRLKGRQRGLYEALYDKKKLKLDYDGTYTRNAAEAFAARSGNCLSLVIMTGAFAREVGMPVQYHMVIGKETWTHSDGLNFSNRHVNLSLGGAAASSFLTLANNFIEEETLMTIDFVTPAEMRSQRRRAMREETVVAMYMNNHAAEALSVGNVNDAYWWARAAMLYDPKFLDAYNTLGVIYRRHGNIDESKRMFDAVIEQEPANISAMSNLVFTLNDLGKTGESQALTRRIEQLRPYAPFHFFDLGQAALKVGNYEEARKMFNEEIDRDQYNHEFHFWLAAAYYGLGDIKQTRKHINIAIENSPTRIEHDAYQAQLASIDAPRLEARD